MSNTQKIPDYSDIKFAKILVCQSDVMDTDTYEDKHFLIQRNWAETCFEFTASLIIRIHVKKTKSQQ